MDITKDEYETVVFEHDFQKKQLSEALEIVKKYILMNKRILVGGMAIDFCLRSKGSKLYPEFKLPDYDFLSPTFHIDAYTIGELISSQGISGVSVIRGMHASTMRVRVNFIAVADIGYIPQNIYDKIPTIQYQGYNVVHPKYQMIDQHRALSLPYENAPFETLINRFEKDMKRYSLLYEHFPITVDDTDDTDGKKTPTNTYKCPRELLKDNCLGGYPALCYWLAHAQTLGYKGKDSVKPIDILDDSIAVDIPVDMCFTIITDDFEKLLKNNAMEQPHKYYNSILDKVPRRILTKNNYELIDNLASMTCARHDETLDCYIANLQTIMCYLLTLLNIEGNTTATALYIQAKDLLDWACSQYINEKDTHKFMVFLPTSETYGCCNWTLSYELAHEDMISKMTNVPATYVVPKNAYPDRGKPIKKELFDFDPSKSDIYQIDGLECKEFSKKCS
jgi:hypothetical protein